MRAGMKKYIAYHVPAGCNRKTAGMIRGYLHAESEEEAQRTLAKLLRIPDVQAQVKLWSKAAGPHKTEAERRGHLSGVRWEEGSAPRSSYKHNEIYRDSVTHDIIVHCNNEGLLIMGAEVVLDDETIVLVPVWGSGAHYALMSDYTAENTLLLSREDLRIVCAHYKKHFDADRWGDIVRSVHKPDDDLCNYLNYGSDFYTEEDILGVHAHVPGHNDEIDWWWIIEFKEEQEQDGKGRFGLVRASCAYTGWDVATEGQTFVCVSLEECVESAPIEDRGREMRRMLAGQIRGDIPFGLEIREEA